MRNSRFDADVYHFLLEQIDTIPQIEALLLLWDTRPKAWSIPELSERLYIDEGSVHSVVSPLAKRQLVVNKPGGCYAYHARGEVADRLMEAVAKAYRQNLVAATVLIHDKASPAVREFARAFVLKKEPE